MCMRKQLRGSKERGAWARELFYILHTADSFLAKVVYFFSRLMRIVKLQASSHSSVLSTAFLVLCSYYRVRTRFSFVGED